MFLISFWILLQKAEAFFCKLTVLHVSIVRHCNKDLINHEYLSLMKRVENHAKKGQLTQLNHSWNIKSSKISMVELFKLRYTPLLDKFKIFFCSGCCPGFLHLLDTLSCSKADVCYSYPSRRMDSFKWPSSSYTLFSLR